MEQYAGGTWKRSLLNLSPSQNKVGYTSFPSCKTTADELYLLTSKGGYK